jgi:hypothetical protein
MPLGHARLGRWDLLRLAASWGALALAAALLPVGLALYIDAPWSEPQANQLPPAQQNSMQQDTAQQDTEARRFRQIQTWLATGEFGPVDEERP